MSNPTVSTTILKQLGGSGRLGVMIGAKNFMYDDTALFFSMPRAKRGINKITIRLAPNDTYSITFAKFAKLSLTTVEVVEEVYVENLRAVIEDRTGKVLSL